MESQTDVPAEFPLSFVLFSAEIMAPIWHDIAPPPCRIENKNCFIQFRVFGTPLNKLVTHTPYWTGLQIQFMRPSERLLNKWPEHVLLIFWGVKLDVVCEEQMIACQFICQAIDKYQEEKAV